MALHSYQGGYCKDFGLFVTCFGAIGKINKCVKDVSINTQTKSIDFSLSKVREYIKLIKKVQ